MTRIFITCAAALLLSGTALAQNPDRSPRADIDGNGEVSLQEFETEARARFDAMDTNFDSFLTRDERRAFGVLRRDKRQGERFARLDANGDGMISEAEYSAANAARDAKRTERRDRRDARQLERFDTDGDGGLSTTEREAAKAVRDARRGERPKRSERRGKPRMDVNGDGRVSRDEYLATSAQLFARMDANGDGVLTKGEGRKRAKRRNRR